MKFVRFNVARYWQESQRWVFDNKITPDKQLANELTELKKIRGAR